MSAYEYKLAEFAREKKLVRMSRPIRDRADVLCDACGSTQPRILYALKDTGSNRYYFVGGNCLQELVRRGAVLRRFSKESGQVAYSAEMQRRAEEAGKSGIPTKTTEGSTSAVDTKSRALVPNGSSLCPAILIKQAVDQYLAVVTFSTPEGMVCGIGLAQEPRYEDIWQRQPDGGVALEKAEKEQSDAVARSVKAAWQLAHLQLEDSGIVPPLGPHLPPETGVLLGLVVTARANRDDSSLPTNGGLQKPLQNNNLIVRSQGKRNGN